MREVFFLFHCTCEEEPKAQSGTTICPRSHGLKVAMPGIEPWWPGAKSALVAIALPLKATNPRNHVLN